MSLPLQFGCGRATENRYLAVQNDFTIFHQLRHRVDRKTGRSRADTEWIHRWVLFVFTSIMSLLWFWWQASQWQNRDKSVNRRNGDANFDNLISGQIVTSESYSLLVRWSFFNIFKRKEYHYVLLIIFFRNNSLFIFKMKHCCFLVPWYGNKNDFSNDVWILINENKSHIKCDVHVKHYTIYYRFTSKRMIDKMHKLR